MSKVVFFGEPLLRLSPEGNMRFLQAEKMDVHFGGAEANVAACMASLGMDCYYVGKVPNNSMGQAFIHALGREGVHTQYIAKGGERIGIYYLENGASVRASQVIYDRAHSSMTEAVIEDFDWDAIFDNTSLLHVTGITPVISRQAAVVTEYAMQQAKKRGILVSLDLNYREKLWQDHIEEKKEWMRKLVFYADYCFGNPYDAYRTLGYQDSKFDFKIHGFEGCTEQSVVERMAKYYDFTGVFFTMRESFSASDNRLSARGYWKGQYLETVPMDVHIVDRVGGGDAFAAGILYGILMGKEEPDLLQFGLATGAIAHTISGDFTITSVEEVESVVASGGAGRVNR